MSHDLSKSSFVKGIQCEKQLYLYKHHYELKDDISQQQQVIFDKGTDVGILAQSLFPGGVNLAPENPRYYSSAIEKTLESIKSGTKIIYEAGFLYDGILVLADIIIKNNDESWNLYEVKSSTELKEVHVYDAALQYYVMDNLGIKINDISIVHINTDYVRHGEIALSSLFKIQTVLNEVINQQDIVADYVSKFKKMLQDKNVPQIDIGIHCKDPYQCSFYNYCRKELPEYSVFDISRLKAEKKYELYYKGIVEIKDVPLDYLNESQAIEVDCYLTGQDKIEKDAIENFVNTLNYPLYFLDFETIQPIIPLFDNSHPYQQIPFQFSLHIKESKEGEIKHLAFLAEPNGDPRKEFIIKMLDYLGSEGDIVVYNQTFELTRIKELAQEFPEYAEALLKLNERVIDLMKPFQKKQLYNPQMKGSYSIKKVLPALVPELSYSDLEISGGSTASESFLSLYYSDDLAVKEKIMNALFEYCKMDTFAMVKILEYLEKLIKQ